MDEVESQIERNLDIVFGIVEALNPSLPSALAAALVQPIFLVLAWLVLGAIVHVVARVFEGQASLAQTYGAVALGAAPQVLGVVHVLPYVEAAGLTMWSVVCAYLAVKHVHGLSANRTFWTLLVSFACMAAVATVIGIAVGTAVALSVFSLVTLFVMSSDTSRPSATW